jgi:type IV pilus assembly protein PilY1
MKNHFNLLRFAFLLIMLWSAGLARAGLTDISNVPMANASNSVVKPNVMFILDDSGSMAWTYTPNDAGNFDSGEYGSKSSQCNGMYFNPSLAYVPPVNSDGTSYPDASFTNAKDNGFDTSAGASTTNLNNRYYYAYSGTQPSLGFTYDSDGDVITTSTFYKECNSDEGDSPGSSVFTKVIVTTASSAALKQNFANWYSYYRTRILTMKTAAGRAFKDIGNSYRVGFTTINETGTTDGDEFLNIADFDATQKESWYSKLYGITPNSGTPLRAALSKVGRIYAGEIGTDPVQYTCQQNFAILSTDGYWNGAAGYMRDGTTALGNQDGSLARPMYDGSTTTTTYTATITVDHNPSRGSGVDNTSTRVSSITVNGVEIMTGTSSGDTSRSDVADNIDAKIGKNGYTATVDGRVVTVTAPASAGNVNGVTPSVTKSQGNMVITASAFSGATSTTGGSSDSLADVAAYYYNTDLRSAMTNNVPGAGEDNAVHQHMTTFTLGLGVNGTLKYADGYATATSGDFYNIRQGTKNWPVPDADNPTAIDDLWHAAVNGHGTYYSAQSPDSLVSGISKSLAGVNARTGSAAAAATSNLEPVAGDNFVYIALYRTVKWDGEIQAKTIDPSTGALESTPSWTAQSLLDSKVAAATDARKIYKFDPDDNTSGGDKLELFTWANLSGAEQNYFNDVCIANPSNAKTLLSQCDALTSTQKTDASGENLLNFIRGRHQHEDRGSNTDKLYRMREHVLGDMINSQPVYVKQPPFAYTDVGYSNYKSSRANNGDARVYVAANDGMLHAFNGGTTAGTNIGGTEEWAYIPPMVMPNLYKLADKNYSSSTVKQYYVDGSPTVGDICPRAPSDTCAANQWKTILVGGLNAGGRGYYALDITDPDSPKALWNYSVADDEDLGYTFGNPIITKNRDGIWVVIFSSGYNNVNPGDGRGHLYILNANTGARIDKISTTAGDTATPSGLGKINAWIQDVADNTALQVYGGDLLGNVWRFDIDDRYGDPGNEATLIAELGNVGSVGVQPITTKPELSEITAGGGRLAVISVGTGRYLGITDVSDTSQQSIYTFKDNLTATGLGKVRNTGVLVQQSLTTNAAGTKRVASTNDVTWTDDSGWYVDLNPGNTSPGERVNVDMQLQLGTLTVAGNVPSTNACNLGGYAWLYNFDYKTGQYVAGSDGTAGIRLSNNSLVAGLKVIKLTSGKTTTLVTGTDGSITPYGNPSSGYGSAPHGKRVSWRELVD